MDIKTVTYQHYIIQGEVTDGPAAGSKVWISGNQKLTLDGERLNGGVVTREQRNAKVYAVATNDTISDHPEQVLEQVQALTVGQPVTWTMELVDPASKGRIEGA